MLQPAVLPIVKFCIVSLSTDKSPLLNGCKSGYGRYGRKKERIIATYGEGDAHEEEKAREPVGKSVGKQDFPVPFYGYHLRENLDDNNKGGPEPQPKQEREHGKQPNDGADEEKEVGQAVEHRAKGRFGLPLAGQIAVKHIGEAEKEV